MSNKNVTESESTNKSFDLNATISKDNCIERDIIKSSIKENMQILKNLRRNLEKEDNKVCQKYYGFCKGDKVKLKYLGKNYTGMVKDIEFFPDSDKYKLFYMKIRLINKQNIVTMQTRDLNVSQITNFEVIEKGKIHEAILDNTIDDEDNYLKYSSFADSCM